eukprot:TRINITY_DN3746_c0_g1_i3.p1 TRINITY_DN3746_c0_g1~~TRINITY_DN3746_c0_g1_i3.p1  ORF type:complete len:315 (-),score=15.12 TRINITY_DN3746_c0_g1_i3:22-966(-)
MNANVPPELLEFILSRYSSNSEVIGNGEFQAIVLDPHEVLQILEAMDPTSLPSHHIVGPSLHVQAQATDEENEEDEEEVEEEDEEEDDEEEEDEDEEDEDHESHPRSRSFWLARRDNAEDEETVVEAINSSFVTTNNFYEKILQVYGRIGLTFFRNLYQVGLMDDKSFDSALPLALLLYVNELEQCETYPTPKLLSFIYAIPPLSHIQPTKSESECLLIKVLLDIKLSYLSEFCSPPMTEYLDFIEISQKFSEQLSPSIWRYIQTQGLSLLLQVPEQDVLVLCQTQNDYTMYLNDKYQRVVSLVGGTPAHFYYQ